MKKILLPFFLMIASLGFSQIKIENATKTESTTQGVFVKNGSQKLTSLDCFNFKDMTISFDIDDSYFTYDQVVVGLYTGTTQRDEESNFGYVYIFTQEEFTRKFKGKKYAYLSLFPEGGMDAKSVMNFRRVDLQTVESKKDLQNTSLYVTVHGGTKTGERYEYRDPYTLEYSIRDKYKYEKLNLLTPIPLSNLFKVSPFSNPATPKGDGNCYN